MNLKKLNQPTEPSQEIKSLDRFQEELSKKLGVLRTLLEGEIIKTRCQEILKTLEKSNHKLDEINVLLIGRE